LKNKGEIISINVSKNKGSKKKPVDEVTINEHGIEGDGHSGNWHRQLSLLSYESIKDINSKGVGASPGDFAENITTSGIDLKRLQIGDILIVRGEDGVRLEVTQIGKECPKPCRIYYLMGSCIMPQEGVFCRVLQPGRIKVGSKIIHVL